MFSLELLIIGKVPVWFLWVQVRENLTQKEDSVAHKTDKSKICQTSHQNPVAICSTCLHFWAIFRRLLWFQMWFISSCVRVQEEKSFFPEVPASLCISVTGDVTSNCLNLCMAMIWSAKLVITLESDGSWLHHNIGRGRATDKNQELPLEVGWVNIRWLKKKCSLQRRWPSFLQRQVNLMGNLSHKLVIDGKYSNRKEFCSIIDGKVQRISYPSLAFYHS